MNHPDLIVMENYTYFQKKNLLQPEPLFYGDLVYKFKRIIGKPNLMIDY